VRKPWILNLLLTALLVAAGLRLRALWLQPPPQAPESAPVKAAAKAPAGARGPGEDAAGEPEEAAAPKPEDYAVIVAKDLFSPARGVAPPAASLAAAPPPKPQPPPKVTLFGVVILDGERVAYLSEGTQETRPRKVREGESFAGGKITAIRADGVTFQFAGRDTSLPLRVPKEGLAPLPAAPQAVSMPVAPGMPVAPAAPVVPRRFQNGRRVPAMPGQAAVPGVPTFVPPAEGTGAGEEETFQEGVDGSDDAGDEGDVVPPSDDEQEAQ
jgi:hypothetical protein